MDDVVLMGDPRVAAVPVEECGEELADATARFAMSDLKADDDPHRSRVRVGLLDRLVVARSLLPDGYDLLWVEGHRRESHQEEHFSAYRAALVGADPSLADDESYRLASRYISPPSVAPHVSGAAIDLTLCSTDGAELDLGTPVNASPEESAGACYTAARVGAEARHHRTVLGDALTAAGLVNYPTEWWHWSYGDRYWALLSGAPAAVYGAVG